MAYAAAVSLKQILEKLLQYSNQLSLVNNPYPNPQIESLYEKVCSLQSFLKENNLVLVQNSSNTTSLVHELETQIIDAICEAEDIIESHLLLISEYENYFGEDEIFAQKLLKVLQQFDAIKISINETDSGGTEILQTRHSQEPFVLSRFVEEKKMFVGPKDILMKLKDQLTNYSYGLAVSAVVGMMGIGKTTLVQQVYNDSTIITEFSCRAWAKIGPTYSVREIVICLLRSMDLDFCPQTNYGRLSDYLHKFLKGRRYLIVLDDMYCDRKMWDDLKKVFPDDKKVSRIIVTTRLMQVAYTVSSWIVHEVRFLDEDESWDLLRFAAIGEESCPFELMKIGKTIARNCQGLPLKIIVLGNLLSRMSRDPEIWSTLADNPKIQNREMLKVTQNLDHEQLPQDIKACFLYMVAFPLYQPILVSKLFKLWVAEGFLEPEQSKTLEDVSEECLTDLVDRSLVLVHELSSTGRIKTCSIHSAIWPFYNRATVEHKICCTIESYKDNANPSHRRFSIQKNILFSIKDVHESIASVLTTRSLLCAGPYHPYPLRVMLSLRLLRVIDAVSIRFYEFPVEILKLVLLRFLALTLNRAELLASVSNLGRLRFLIVRRHSSIIKSSCGASCYLPMEIWNMKELRHLQVMGSDLPVPLNENALLPNLLTLSDVSALSCTREVLSRIPNLKKVGIRVESAWDAPAAETWLIFDHLNRLETAKCVIVNPVFVTQVDTLPYLFPVFPDSLKKLTLSGCGLSWEYIGIIGQLPNLEVLKLRFNALRGPEWEVNMSEFCSLNYLLLEDLDIEEWRADEFSFPVLKRLAIRHCYKLHEISSVIENVPPLQTIDLVHCNPSVVDSAMRKQEEQIELGNEWFQVRISSIVVR